MIRTRSQTEYSSHARNSAALMSIVMVRDKVRKAMGANTYKAEVENLMEFIVETWHGGMWCAPYDMKSTAVSLRAVILFSTWCCIGLYVRVVFFYE